MSRAFGKIMAGLEDAIAYVEGDTSRARVVAGPDVKAIRKASGKSQGQFAKTYHLPVGTIRDWEQRRRVPDAPARAAVDHQGRSSGRREASGRRPVNEDMQLSDFSIGLEFYMGDARWRCTDIGSRTVIAIKLDAPDESWYNGPPYGVVEYVIDEYDFGGCSLEPEEP